MEAVLMKATGDYKHRIGNPKTNFVTNLFPAYPSDDLVWATFLAGGRSLLPQSSLCRHSYPPAVSVFQQPPLLPLPISTHQKMNNIYRSNPYNTIPSSAPNKNMKNLTPKKSKKNTKREVVPPAEKHVPESSIDQMIGPDLPMNVISSPINKSCDIVSVDVDKFSGPIVFTSSPPPSSLPLPTFSLRPKLSCNSQAAGVDAGATDSLRRLLRL